MSTATRPCMRYEFAAPRLEDLAAGQKLLLRMEPARAARVRVWLRRVREALTRAAPPR